MKLSTLTVVVRPYNGGWSVTSLVTGERRWRRSLTVAMAIAARFSAEA